MAFSNSDSFLTFVMPIEEPRCTGFTNTGQLSSAMRFFICTFSVSHCARVNQQNGTTEIPSAKRTCFVNALSIATAEANMSHPADGTPAIRSNPIKLPSSPYVPCMDGNTTSMRTDFDKTPGQEMPRPFSNDNRTGFCRQRIDSKSGRLKNAKSFIALSAYHFPFLDM